MTKYTKTLTTNCPSCDAQIRFDRTPRLGDVIVCHECDESLEVVRLSPLIVDWSLLDDDENWADVDTDNPNDSYARYAPDDRG